jgi:chorismate mutase/SAM-dependent methyltransferase
MSVTEGKPTYTEELAPLREEIDMIDGGLIALLGRRGEVVRQVGHLKKLHEKNIMASDREAAKFSDIEKKCQTLGLNFDFVAELWSTIMFFSKVSECVEAKVDTFQSKEPVPADMLRKNLLELAELSAPSYNDEYCNGSDANAVRGYRSRELHMMKRAIKGLPSNACAIDLGCATGQVLEELETHFERLIGFDVSRHMCTEARKRRAWPGHVEFREADLSVGIPMEDSSVDFAVATFGSASEFGENLLSELRRVLKPKGKAVLSYYNEDALLNFWFYPWPSTVRARLNRYNGTIEVWAHKRVFTIEATGTTVDKLRVAFRSKGLDIVDKNIESYPTLQAIVPRFFFTAPHSEAGDMTRIAKEIDDHLARNSSGLYKGTYILTEVQKK